MDPQPSLEKNIESIKTECEDSMIMQCQENLVNSLADLKKLFSDVTSHSNSKSITYSLLELLQGIGNTESANTTKIQPSKSSSVQKRAELSPYNFDKKSFQRYVTPLSRFKSYRLNPKFASGSMLSIRSATFSNEIQPDMTICHYDLLGTCNDSSCAHTHLDEKCVLSTHSLINDLLAYYLNNMDGCHNLDNAERQRKLLNLYTNQFMKKYGDKLSLDRTTSLLWNHLKEFCRIKKLGKSGSVIFDNRNWFYQDKYRLNTPTENCIVHLYSTPFDITYFLKNKCKKGDNVFNENQEIRYFSERYNSVELLKERLEENPSDVNLWISLVQRILSDDKGRNCLGKHGFKKISANVREYALSILSQGCEENPCSEELWIHYLNLFSMNCDSTKLRELCYHAVMYAANYNVWWTCLTLEMTITGKQEICTEMIKFILGGQENARKKSHYLTETVLYVTQLLICSGRFEDSKNYVRDALGIDVSRNDLCKKNSVKGICEDLTREDKSLLWISLISLQMFGDIPAQMFSVEVSGPGRLVNKENFLLDWQNGSWSASEDDARSLFKDALHVDHEKSVQILKDMMLLYENFLAFELSLGNIESAVNILRGLVTEFPTFVDGWRFLLLLYIQFFPTEDVLVLGEEAVNKSDSNPMIIYFFSKFLLERKLHTLALQHITSSCLPLLDNDDNSNDAADTVVCIRQKYKKLIVSKSSKEDYSVYHSLCYCLLSEEGLDSCNTKKEVLDSFQYVIHLYNSPKDIKLLWMACIEYNLNQLSNTTVVSPEEYQSFIDLLFQCLASVSAIGVVGENPNLCWRDYEFHNKIIDMALAIIPVDKHSELYQKLMHYMPDNIALALRICDHEFEQSNYEQVQVIYSSMITEFPDCLQLWKTALKTETKCGNVKEVRRLLNEATRALPFCLFLWKEFAKFEIFNSHNFEQVKVKLKDIASKALTFGIDLHTFIPKF